jgi:hypothetical protein
MNTELIVSVVPCLRANLQIRPRGLELRTHVKPTACRTKRIASTLLSVHPRPPCRALAVRIVAALPLVVAVGPGLVEVNRVRRAGERIQEDTAAAVRSDKHTCVLIEQLDAVVVAVVSHGGCHIEAGPRGRCVGRAGAAAMRRSCIGKAADSECPVLTALCKF